MRVHISFKGFFFAHIMSRRRAYRKKTIFILQRKVKKDIQQGGMF